MELEELADRTFVLANLIASKVADGQPVPEALLDQYRAARAEWDKLEQNGSEFN